MRRARLALALAIAFGAACGKYGPPVRGADERPPKPPPVAAAPAADTEQCPDPNAPAPAVAEPTP